MLASKVTSTCGQLNIRHWINTVFVQTKYYISSQLGLSQIVVQLLEMLKFITKRFVNYALKMCLFHNLPKALSYSGHDV